MSSTMRHGRVFPTHLLGFYAPTQRSKLNFNFSRFGTFGFGQYKL